MKIILSQSIQKKENELIVPPILYHATFGENLKYIQQNGLQPLGGNEGICAFPGCEMGVYLANNAPFAKSFVDVAENKSIPQDWFDDIVVLEIDVAQLDTQLLKKDPHMNMGDNPLKYSSYIYRGTIPISAIKNLHSL
jgi:hypothetical protein